MSLNGHFKNTVVAETCNVTAVPKGLLKKLKNFKLVHAISCHLDFLNSLKSLFLVFHTLNIPISIVQLHVQNTGIALSSPNVVPYQHISNGKCQDVPLN